MNCWYHTVWESYGITTKFFDVICHKNLVGSRLAEVARNGNSMLMKSLHVVQVEHTMYTVKDQSNMFRVCARRYFTNARKVFSSYEA